MADFGVGEYLAVSALVMGAAGAGTAAYSAKTSANYQEAQMEQEAKQAEAQANEQAIARREELIKALAMQSAKTGGAGITSVGTPAQIVRTDIAEEESQEKRLKLGAQLAASQSRSAGAYAKSSGNLAAGSAIASGVGNSLLGYASLDSGSSSSKSSNT